jgi:hypothetical protein
VVLIFAVVKFTEGAWLVVLIFPLGVLALVRLNRRYRAEAAALTAAADDAGHTKPLTTYSRHQTIVLVDNVDLATLGAVRYARGKRSTDLRAVHFVVDDAHAEDLRQQWCLQPALADVPLDLVDCPDRRLARAALELAAKVTADPGTDLTLLLPRRTYSPILGRLLHDRTADEIARATSRLPRVVATIIPFDVEGAIDEPLDVDSRRTLLPAAGHTDTGSASRPRAGVPRLRPESGASGSVNGSSPGPAAAAGTTQIGALEWRHRATVEGDVRSVRVAALSGAPTLEVELWDRTGGVTLVFYGRRHIPGLEPGRRVRARGMVGDMHGGLAISNPEYELVAPRRA